MRSKSPSPQQKEKMWSVEIFSSSSSNPDAIIHWMWDLDDMFSFPVKATAMENPTASKTSYSTSNTSPTSTDQSNKFKIQIDNKVIQGRGDEDQNLILDLVFVRENEPIKRRTNAKPVQTNTQDDWEAQSRAVTFVACKSKIENPSVALGCASGEIYVEQKDGTMSVLTGHCETIVELVFSSDDGWLVSRSSDDAIVIWKKNDLSLFVAEDAFFGLHILLSLRLHRRTNNHKTFPSSTIKLI